MTHKTINLSGINHCSTVCPSPYGTLLAWYSGSGECNDDQSVFVMLANSTIDTAVRIGNKTGNPILWENNKGDITLLYSKFEDAGKIRGKVDRWKYCSIWVQELEIHNGVVSLKGQAIMIIPSNMHLLARCNPLITDYNTIIPMYDEMNRNCVIVEYDNDASIIVRSAVSTGIIQPTLWLEDNKMCLLARNFGNGKRYSQYCESLDGGHIWSDPADSRIPNMNNSIHVIWFNGDRYIIWNDTFQRNRNNLTIGILKSDSKIYAEPIEVISSSHGCYPSMCVTDNELCFSFTSFKSIEYYEWNRKEIKKRIGRRDTAERRV